MRAFRAGLAVIGLIAAHLAAEEAAAAAGAALATRGPAAVDRVHQRAPVHLAKTCAFTAKSLRPLPCQPDDQPPGSDTADGGSGTGTDSGTDTGAGGDAGSGGTGSEPTAPPQRVFAYHPPGDLHAEDQRTGREDRRIYLPGIVFPIALGDGQHPAMNSQIFGYGGGGWGGKGAPGGTECDTRNYNPFEQRDNFCEVRTWPMPFCPSGSGHQGQDIRPPSCADAKWLAVAVVSGTITRVTTYTTVILKGDDGTNYYYLHLARNGMKVKVGQRIEHGDPIGYVSNIMGGKRGTTIHLHFAAKQNVEADGRVQSVYVPVYTSLVAALRRAKGLGPSADADGNLIVDANFEIGAPPVVVPPPSQKPDPVPQPDPTPTPTPGDDDTLAAARERIAQLKRELNELKVESERRIATANDEAKDARVALAQAEEKLTAAQQRIDALEAAAERERQAALEREAGLRGEIDRTAIVLAQVRAELDAIKAEQAKQGLWQRTRNWIESLWKME